MKEKDMKKTETVKRIKKKEEPEWVVSPYRGSVNCHRYYYYRLLPQ